MDSWLRLANLQLPARIANGLLEHFGTPEAIFAASPEELEALSGLTERQAARLADPSFIPTTSQWAYLRRADVRLLTRGSDDYPLNLRDIPDPPPVLFARGAIEEKDRFAVAIVGSRQSSPYGRGVTARLTRDLARAGLTIVSGGAVGIDAAAHRAALEAGGRTCVVLGCGLDIDYPRENQALFERIVEQGQGALLTEFPLGATPEPWRFPLRNRVISGLSMGVIVVEAGTQSGALLTAGLAAEQGREVMAVPGNVDRPGARGTNGLIKDGATLVEEAQDVMRALGVLALETPKPEESAPSAVVRDLPEAQRRLLECLSLTPKHVDALAADVQMPAVQVGVEMTLLELSGLVRRLPGNCYVRAL